MKKAAIICGGYSSEYDISVLSATNIQQNFPDEYKAYLVYLRKEGWFVQLEGQEVEMNPANFSFLENGNEQQFDLAIVWIHGDPGENGKVQSYLEMIDMPYVNSSPLASQISFDKWFCNQFIKGFGYSVADSIHLSDAKKTIDAAKIVAQLGLPIFVKPCDSGSSFGIAKVERVEDLDEAVVNAFKEGRTVVLESFLDGTEVTCGLFRKAEEVVALPLTEIVTENAFFDYEAKYQGLSEEITPARISEEVTLKVQQISREIYSLLQLRSLARVDFMIVNDQPHIIEVNTIPGFSNESLVPKMIAAANITTKELWREILKAEL